jgi:hypothetical protein
VVLIDEEGAFMSVVREWKTGTVIFNHGSSESVAGRDLSGTPLRDADFRSADLRGTNLSNCDLTGALLRGAYVDGRTNIDGARINPEDRAILERKIAAAKVELEEDIALMRKHQADMDKRMAGRRLNEV